MSTMIRGQRFELDLDGEAEGNSGRSGDLPGAFVGDILERKPAAATPPSAPTLKSKGGFPEHRKRKVESRFKQQNAISHDQSDSSRDVSRQHQSQGDRSAQLTRESGKAKTWEEEEKERINLENRQKLAEMSPDEIEQDRQELMESLSPALLQRLLQKSNIDSGSAEANLSSQSPAGRPETKEPKRKSNKSVSFAEPDSNAGFTSKAEVNDDEDNDDLETLADPLPHSSVHFPRPPQPPDLDPSSDTFLQDLHEKYFPSLPSDPDKLEWMQSQNSTKSNYDPLASALSPKDLRFSFRGDLIAPKTASEIPVTAGLHHHGDAPDAAGYTIPELAHLAHSSFAPQRCIAFQTLGRILYRLGRGEFGDSGEPGADAVGAEETFGELARGLWREVEREKVIETLVNESEGKGVDWGRHVSARAYATEAVWLWRKGGGRRWKAE